MPSIVSLLAVSLLSMLVACSEGNGFFKPYDYDKQEDAEVKLPKSKSSIKVRSDEFILRRKIQFPQ